jgi:hypothetical protein
VPDSSVAALNEMKDVASETQVASASDDMRTTPLPEQEGRKVAAHKHPHIKTISVSKALREENTDNTMEMAYNTTRENSILVVRSDFVPQSGEENNALAPASGGSPLQLSAPLAQAKADTDSPQMKVIHINDRRPAEAATASRKSGPNFIFSD